MALLESRSSCVPSQSTWRYFASLMPDDGRGAKNQPETSSEGGGHVEDPGMSRYVLRNGEFPL